MVIWFFPTSAFVVSDAHSRLEMFFTHSSETRKECEYHLNPASIGTFFIDGCVMYLHYILWFVIARTGYNVHLVEKSPDAI